MPFKTPNGSFRTANTMRQYLFGNVPDNCTRYAAIFTLAAVLAFTRTAQAAGSDFFRYLYQRSIYTDNLIMPGAWWANPASIAEIDAPGIYTANVLPLGDELLISSFRLFFPIAKNITIGASILGAGTYKAGTSISSVTEKGLSYSSSFAFKRPRFQLGAAAPVPYAGSIGVLGTIGSDLKSYGSTSEGTASPGAGFGWLSPSMLDAIQISAAVMFIYHNLDPALWEKGGKIGMRFNALDSLLSGSAEYTFSFGRGFGVFTPDRAEYESFKTLVSARLYRQVALTAGYSTDLDYSYRNGHCAHAGAELRKSPLNPFVGGYDIGFRFGQDWILIHRIWVGVNLRILTQAQQPVE